MLTFFKELLVKLIFLIPLSYLVVIVFYTLTALASFFFMSKWSMIYTTVSVCCVGIAYLAYLFEMKN